MDGEENEPGGRRAHNKGLSSRVEVDNRLRMNLRRRDTWIKRRPVSSIVSYYFYHTSTSYLLCYHGWPLRTSSRIQDWG